MYIVYFFQVSWIRHKDTHLLTAGRLVNSDPVDHHLKCNDHINLKCNDHIKDDDDHHLKFVCYLLQTSSFGPRTESEWEAAGSNVSYICC